MRFRGRNDRSRNTAHTHYRCGAQSEGLLALVVPSTMFVCNNRYVAGFSSCDPMGRLCVGRFLRFGAERQFYVRATTVRGRSGSRCRLSRWARPCAPNGGSNRTRPHRIHPRGTQCHYVLLGCCVFETINNRRCSRAPTVGRSRHDGGCANASPAGVQTIDRCTSSGVPTEPIAWCVRGRRCVLRICLRYRAHLSHPSPRWLHHRHGTAERPPTPRASLYRGRVVLAVGSSRAIQRRPNVHNAHRKRELEAHSAPAIESPNHAGRARAQARRDVYTGLP